MYPAGFYAFTLPIGTFLLGGLLDISTNYLFDFNMGGATGMIFGWANLISINNKKKKILKLMIQIKND